MLDWENIKYHYINRTRGILVLLYE